MPRFAGIKPHISPLCEVLCLAYIDDFRKNEQPPSVRRAAAFRLRPVRGPAAPSVRRAAAFRLKPAGKEQPPLNREAAAFVTSCANAIDLSAQGAVIYLFLLRRSMTMNTAHATASTPTTTSKAMIAACHQARL